MSKQSPRTYPQEVKDRAVLMVQQRPEGESLTSATKRAAGMLDITTHETIRNWVRQARIDAGAQPGVTTAESEEIRRLKRENAELKRANGILKAASAFFAAEPGRPRG